MAIFCMLDSGSLFTDYYSFIFFYAALYRDKEVLSEGGKQCGFQNDVIGTTCGKL